MSAPTFAATTPADAGLFPDPIVAKGKAFTVKRSELDVAYQLLKANATASGQTIPDDRRDFFQARLLDRLISTRVLVAHASAADKTKAVEAADKFVADARRRLNSEEMFKLQLKGMGLTVEEFRERILEQAICDEVITRELRSAIVVADADARKYYDENPKKFEEPEQVRAAHVLISTKDPTDPSPNPSVKRELPAPQKEAKRKLAESVLARARKGDDFAKLAKEFSDDPGSKETGGEYTFPRGRMVAEFEAAAFGLPAGQISEIVTTLFGYHIIKVIEKLPAKKSEFAKVSENIKKQLQEEHLQKQMPDYLQKLRKEAGVEILEDSLKVNVSPTPSTAP